MLIDEIKKKTITKRIIFLRQPKLIHQTYDSSHELE
jgi:hypothetical protein